MSFFSPSPRIFFPLLTDKRSLRNLLHCMFCPLHAQPPKIKGKQDSIAVCAVALQVLQALTHIETHWLRSVNVVNAGSDISLKGGHANDSSSFAVFYGNFKILHLIKDMLLDMVILDGL